MPLIELAVEGRVEMINAIFGGKKDESSSALTPAEKIKAFFGSRKIGGDDGDR